MSVPVCLPQLALELRSNSKATWAVHPGWSVRADETTPRLASQKPTRPTSCAADPESVRATLTGLLALDTSRSTSLKSILLAHGTRPNSRAIEPSPSVCATAGAGVCEFRSGSCVERPGANVHHTTAGGVGLGEQEGLGEQDGLGEQLGLGEQDGLGEQLGLEELLGLGEQLGLAVALGEQLG